MNQILIMMLGHPGSGKSYFTKQLAPLIHAVRLNGDHMRTSMFTNPADRDNPANNPKVFGAIDYAVHEVLKAGYSVVYDAQHNKLSDRKQSVALAAEFGVPAVLVWIKTPYDVALQRGINREDTPDQRRKAEADMRAFIDRHMQELEEPGQDEPCIVIDGTLLFEDQYKSFTEQLERLLPASTSLPR